MAGEQLTVLQCANDGIASLPRRILDLRNKKVCISDKWEGGVKVYYMTDTDAFLNKLGFIPLGEGLWDLLENPPTVKMTLEEVIARYPLTPEQIEKLKNIQNT